MPACLWARSKKFLSAAVIALLLGLPAFTCPCRAEGTTSDVPAPHLSFAFVDGNLYPLSLALTWDFSRFDLRLGWLPLNWGPAPEDNLVFAPTRGHLMLYMAGELAGMELIPPFHWEQAYLLLEPHDGLDRYMIARRYLVNMGRFELGYTEGAILSGDFSPWYLNPYPLVPIMVTQLVLQYLGAPGGGNDYCNAVMAIDAAYRGERTDVYLAFFADDMPPTSSWANYWKIGLQAGAVIREPQGWTGTDLWLEYTAITRHTYSYYADYPAGDWVDGPLLLGDPLGPDADRLRFRFTWADPCRYIEIQRERHGEGRFPDPAGPVTVDTLEFLTGTVETSYWLRAGRSFAPGENFAIEIDLGAAYVTNLDNVAGRTGTKIDFSARLAYSF